MFETNATCRGSDGACQKKSPGSQGSLSQHEERSRLRGSKLVYHLAPKWSIRDHRQRLLMAKIHDQGKSTPTWSHHPQRPTADLGIPACLADTREPRLPAPKCARRAHAFGACVQRPSKPRVTALEQLACPRGCGRGYTAGSFPSSRE